MITRESLTVEEVEAELKALETAFKAERKKLRRRCRGARDYFGGGAPECGKATKALLDLEAKHYPHARKLRALLAVLKEEQPTDTKKEGKESE